MTWAQTHGSGFLSVSSLHRARIIVLHLNKSVHETYRELFLPSLTDSFHLSSAHTMAVFPSSLAVYL